MLIRNRITSYNVCYTKLLREDGVAESESQYLFDHCLMRVSDEVDVTNESHYKAIITEGEPNFKKKDYLNHIYNVITSYSIHYTKLYDPDC